MSIHNLIIYPALDKYFDTADFMGKSEEYNFTEKKLKTAIL
jgi:hypothetical protein